MKEKLQEYALIAEIISALCIVLSLIFVGLQVRQGTEETATNSAAITASVRESMLQTDINLLLYVGDHQLLASVIEVQFGEDLTLDQVNALIAALLAEIRSREIYWSQHEAGILDDATYYSFRDSFISGLESNPRYRAVWGANLEYSDLTPGFVSEITQELERRSIIIE